MRQVFQVKGRTRQEVRNAARERVEAIEHGEGTSRVEWRQLHLVLRPEEETYTGAVAMWIGTVTVSDEDVEVYEDDDLGLVMGDED